MSKESRPRVPGVPGSPFTRALAALALVAAIALPVRAASWTPSGVAFVSATGDQSSLRAVTDGRGGFIAAWIDTNGGTPHILSQRVDSTGVPRWAANGVAVNSAAGAAAGLAVAPDNADGILLAWVANRAVGKKNVRVQRLNASGAPQWGPDGRMVDLTAADTLQGSPSIVSDRAGGAIVAWVDGRGTDDDVYAQRVLADSTRSWGAGGVLLAVDTDPQQFPRVLADTANGVIVSWEDVGTNLRTYFQHLDGSGTPQWAANGVTPGTSKSESAFMARYPGSDSLLVVWWTDAGGPSRILGSKLRDNGTFVTTNGNLMQQTVGRPIGLVTQAGGTGLLVFADATSIQGLAVNSAGAAPGATTGLATAQALVASSSPGVVPDGAGGLYATWASAGSVRAQHLTAANATDWGSAPVELISGLTPQGSRPVAVSGGDLLVAWIDARNTGTTGDDLFAQRVSPSGVTGSYWRIYAFVAGGNGAFSVNGGHSWVREGDSLNVQFAGTGGHHVDHTTVGTPAGTANLGPVPNYTFHNVGADSTLQAYFVNTPIVTQFLAPANAYRAFSLPSTFANNAVSSVFAGLMPYDPVRWRFGHWSPDSNRYVEPTSGLTTVLPATGYWFIGAKDTTLSFSGTFLPEAPYTIPLRRSSGGQGWNQFGSPFMFPVAFSQLRLSAFPDSSISSVTNIYTDHQILEWNANTQSYAAVGLLLPGHAYWLWRQSATPVSLFVPFTWNPVALTLPVPALASSADWSIGLTARSGEREARLEFGAAPVADGRWNGLSAHALPDGPGGGLSLVARVADWGEDNGGYASVFRPDAETLRWDFDASAPAGLSEATLAFAFDRLPAGRHVVLSEPATGWSRDVAADANVPLVLSATARHLRLEVLANGPVAPRVPLATALRAMGPNPSRDVTTLSFALAHAGPLRWDVFDLAGRRVVSGARTLEPGEHAITWDGRDGSGRRVQPGLYLLRWQADGRSGTARLVRMD